MLELGFEAKDVHAAPLVVEAKVDLKEMLVRQLGKLFVVIIVGQESLRTRLLAIHVSLARELLLNHVLRFSIHFQNIAHHFCAVLSWGSDSDF